MKVRSFPRSGTHWLMALLWTNFKLGDAPNTQPVRHTAAPGENVWAGPDGKCPWHHLFGGHGLFGFQEEPSECIYIVRHPYDVFRSLYRHVRAPQPFEEWMHLDARAAGLSWIYDAALPMCEFWLGHVGSFMGHEQVELVTYEELLDDATDVLWRLQERFGLLITQELDVNLPRVGWDPGDGACTPATVPPSVRAHFRLKCGDTIMGYKL